MNNQPSDDDHTVNKIGAERLTKDPGYPQIAALVACRL
jgi:hypothetical protein